MARKTRSPAQILASRVNGARSRGPTTSEGRATSSMNAVSHGVLARKFVADEEAPEFQEVILAWTGTLPSTTATLSPLVHRVAHVDFRRMRLKKLEQEVLNAETDARLAKSETAMQLAAALLALEGLKALAELAENVTQPTDGGDAVKLLSGMRRICHVTEQADAPVNVLLPLSESVDAFAVAAFTEIDVEAFRRVARACREAELCLAERRADLEQLLLVERESLKASLLWSGSKAMQRVDRYRARLDREFEAALDAYDKARVVAASASSSGSNGQAPEVELRLVGPTSRQA